MQQPRQARDLLGYAGSPPHPHWPGGARIAVSIVANFEEGAEFSVTDGDTENEAVYEIEQPVLGQPNPAIDSQADGDHRGRACRTAGNARTRLECNPHRTPLNGSSSAAAPRAL